MWRLIYYETATGRCPVQEYFDAIGAREAGRIAFDLDLLGTYGLELGAPHVRSIAGKLWELRTTGRPQHRVLYFAVSGRRFVLLHAFTKKTRKTPTAEIATAQRRMVDYTQREEP
jgi:phage-related protein